MIARPLILNVFLLNGLLCSGILSQRILLLSSGSLSFFPTGAPNILEVFVAIVATKDLTFIWNLFAANRHGLFEDASCTLFRVRSLVSGVVGGQDDVSAFGDIFRECNELKEKCEALEQENPIAKNESVELWKKDKLAYSL